MIEKKPWDKFTPLTNNEIAALICLVKAAIKYRNFSPKEYMGDCDVPEDIAREELFDAVDAIHAFDLQNKSANDLVCDY